MFGAMTGYVAPVATSTFGVAAACKAQYLAHQNSTSHLLFGKPVQCGLSDEEPALDVSMDLLPYMSDSLDLALTNSADTNRKQQQKTAAVIQSRVSSIGSRCSTQSGHAMPDSPVSRQQHPEQQPPCKRCRITCSCDAGASSSCQTDQPAGTSSASNSSSSMLQEVPMALQAAGSLPEPCSPSTTSGSSSSMAYDDNFVWECYFGDPNSTDNQQRQRPKVVSPFAVFATFPGFSL